MDTNPLFCHALGAPLYTLSCLELRQQGVQASKKYVPFVGTKGTKNPRDGSLSKLCVAMCQRAVNSLCSNIRRDNTCQIPAFACKAKKLLTNPEP